MWLVVDARPEIWQKDNVTRAIIDIGQRPRSSLPFSLRTFKQMALLRKLIVSTVTIVALYTVRGNRNGPCVILAIVSLNNVGMRGLALLARTPTFVSSYILFKAFSIYDH